MEIRIGFELIQANWIDLNDEIPLIETNSIELKFNSNSFSIVSLNFYNDGFPFHWLFSPPPHPVCIFFLPFFLQWQ